MQQLPFNFFALLSAAKQSDTKREHTESFRKARWPGRMEKISSQPTIIIDGAHNPHAIKEFVDTVTEKFQQGKKYILFSALTTKNSRKMIRQMQQIPNNCLIITTFDYPKALKKKILFEKIANLNIIKSGNKVLRRLLLKWDRKILFLLLVHYILYRKFAHIY